MTETRLLLSSIRREQRVLTELWWNGLLRSVNNLYLLERFRHKKCCCCQSSDLQTELDASNNESRNYSLELCRLRAAWEEVREQGDLVKRENKNLAEEIRDLLDQLGDGSRSIQELEKQRRRLEVWATPDNIPCHLTSCLVRWKRRVCRMVWRKQRRPLNKKKIKFSGDSWSWLSLRKK